MYPVYLIMTTGRTGSDYLQACLDNVKGVMTFCGKFEYPFHLPLEVAAHIIL